MRNLPIGDVQVGDRLASNLYGSKGEIMLPAGTELDEHHLVILQRRGYLWIPVEMPGFEGIEPIAWVDSTLLREIYQLLTALPERFDVATATRARRIAERLVDSVAEHPKHAYEIVHLGGGEAAPVEVAVNRSLIVAVVGAGDIDESRLIDTVMAALLLDAGRGNALERGIVEDIDDAEQLHAQSNAAAAYLRSVERTPTFTIASILQVSARWDGSGVPPIEGDKIWKGAQLLAPANKLARLVVQTAQHPAVPPHEALEWLMGGASTEYSLYWLRKLQGAVAPYGVGTAVRLSDGHVGVVTEVPRGMPARPRIRLLGGSMKGVEWDLREREHRNVTIVGVETARELTV